MTKQNDSELKTPAGLGLMRERFPDNQIGKLVKGSKAQTQCQPNEKKNCPICGGWHHPKMVHLDYVGHAALTDRLLDCDINWQWEPMATDDAGLPLFDSTGGMWIKLTVCGVTRLGYGNAASSQYKEVGSREKEVIGDALRNAAMRFGAALELWHKGELHTHEEKPREPEYMDDAIFKKNLPTYTKMIQSGKKTVSELMSFLSTKAMLTPEQCEALESIKMPEPIEGEVINEQDA